MRPSGAKQSVNRRRSESAEDVREQLVSTAESVLSGKVGVIEGSRLLWRLGSEWYGDHDPDFIIFVTVDSETDHLPVDDERKNWGEEALREKDEEIAKFEALYREPVLAACKRALERFNQQTM